MPSVPDFEIPTKRIVPPADVPNVLRPEFLSGDTAAEARHAEIVDRIIAGRKLRAANEAVDIGGEIIRDVVPQTAPAAPQQPQPSETLKGWTKTMDVVLRAPKKAHKAPSAKPKQPFMKSSCTWCGGWLRSGEVRIHKHCETIEARAKAKA
jgi:hypothetical protein